MDGRVTTTSTSMFLDSEQLIKKLSSIDSQQTVTLLSEDIETELRRTELEIRKEDLEGQKQDRDQRKKFADNIFWLLVSFLSATLIIVSLSAIKRIGFALSDTVLIALLTTTTANIIAIFVLVVRYLFKSNICPRCGVKISSKNEISAKI